MLLAPALAALIAAAPVAGADLKRAEQLFTEFKYAEARAALLKARAEKGLSRDALLRILELQGVSSGQLRQTTAAEAAFKELLVLDPGHKLEAEYAPRVMTPFFAAGQFVTEKGALELRATPPVTTATGVEAVGVELVRDPLAMARGVRFHLREADGSWKVTPGALSGAKASLPVAAAEAAWWCELLGDNEAQLALVGSEAAPQLASPPVPVVVVAPPPPPPPLPELTARPTFPLRTTSYFLVGGAAVAGGLGAWFGLRSASGFSTLETATRDSAGRISSLTEVQAYAINTAARQSATIANSLFIGAGVLAIAGVVMWFLGAPVALSPAGSGVALSGSLP